VLATLTGDGAELTMDLAGAYPAAAGIRWWQRTVRLERRGGPGGRGRVLVEDAWDLNHDPERVVVHLIASRPPRTGGNTAPTPPAGPAGPGRLLIPADDGDLAIGYPDAAFGVTTEERPVADRQLAATWGPTVYRITLAARRPARRGGSRLEISAAPGASARAG